MNDRRAKILLKPAVLKWAPERAGLAPDELAGKLHLQTSRVEEWEKSGQISIAQISSLSRITRTPEGYLYLAEPPEDTLPITDFRTISDRPLSRPSPDLLEIVYDMQRRQSWMRDELIADESPRLEFVSAFNPSDPVKVVSDAIRKTLGLSPEWASEMPSWESALRRLRDCIENAGILVVINGIVGNNRSRKLEPDEFRGFALVDDYAPLIFINNSDYKSAQIFTFAHELAHIFVGEEGVSNFDRLMPTPNEIEQYCNSIAAELLIPSEALKSYWPSIDGNGDIHQLVARRFKVSVIVAARRALDLELIDRSSFFTFYRQYQLNEGRRQEVRAQGGDFWNNQNVRVGRRFAAAVIRAVKERRLSRREAYSLTGLRGPSFDAMISRMGA